MSITKRTIDSLAYEGNNNSRHVVWDDRLPGFGVRVYPSGRKAFVLSYRAEGRKRQLTIGTYGALTLAEAKERAQKYLVTITDGDDPLAKRIQRATAETLDALCSKYIENYAKQRKKTWYDDKLRIDNRILPAWKGRKVISIKRADVSALHTRIGADTPYEANRVLALISKLFDLAEQWGFVPAGTTNPSAGIEKFKEKKRDRWVTQEEMPKLIQSINETESHSVKSALWLYLLTGMRKTELLALKWADVDLPNMLLSVQDTKSGSPLYLPLSVPAIKILVSIPHVIDNPYVFVGKVEGHHLVNIDKPWRKIRSNAGMDDVRLHDLRRTVGSWLAQSGNSLHLIGKVLNHSNTSTTAVYARFGQDQVRTALDNHGERILEFAEFDKGKKHAS